MDRKQVYAIIDQERAYQHLRWGRDDGSRIPKTTGEYLVYIKTYLDRAMTELSTKSGEVEALDDLRKVIALGVACAEDNGLTAREPGPVINGHTGVIEYLPQP